MWVPPPGALGHDLRVEGDVAIPRHLQVHVAGLGQQPRGREPVTGVAAAPPGRIALLLAWVGQSALQPARAPAPPWSSAAAESSPNRPRSSGSGHALAQTV